MFVSTPSMYVKKVYFWLLNVPIQHTLKETNFERPINVFIHIEKLLLSPTAGKTRTATLIRAKHINT